MQPDQHTAENEPHPERPPIATSPLSVVLLAGADMAETTAALDRWTAFLDTLKRDYEIVLVGEAAALPTETSRWPQVRGLPHTGPPGLGARLRTGLAAARLPLLSYSYCDDQFRPDDLKLLLDKVDLVDLVTGLSFGRPVPWWRRWTGRLYRGLLRVMCGLSLEPPVAWLGWRSACR